MRNIYKFSVPENNKLLIIGAVKADIKINERPDETLIERTAVITLPCPVKPSSFFLKK